MNDGLQYCTSAKIRLPETNCTLRKTMETDQFDAMSLNVCDFLEKKNISI